MKDIKVSDYVIRFLNHDGEKALNKTFSVHLSYSLQCLLIHILELFNSLTMSYITFAL